MALTTTSLIHVVQAQRNAGAIDRDADEAVADISPRQAFSLSRSHHLNGSMGFDNSNDPAPMPTIGPWQMPTTTSPATMITLHQPPSVEDLVLPGGQGDKDERGTGNDAAYASRGSEQLLHWGDT
jgi:hypothetical protein